MSTFEWGILYSALDLHQFKSLLSFSGATVVGTVTAELDYILQGLNCHFGIAFFKQTLSCPCHLM